MPDLIIFVLGVIVMLFALVAVILIGISEAEGLREAGIPDPGADGEMRYADAADQLSTRQGGNR